MFLTFAGRASILCLCHKRIIPRKEKEASPTGFWFAPELRLAKGYYLREEEKAAPGFPFKMLPKKNRLDRKTLGQIFKEGRTLRSSGITLRFLEDQSPGLPRISIVVPKTLVKQAVLRNTLRRRGYKAAKPYLARLPQGFRGVIILSPKNADEKTSSQINKRISEIFKTFLP